MRPLRSWWGLLLAGLAHRRARRLDVSARGQRPGARIPPRCRATARCSTALRLSRSPCSSSSSAAGARALGRGAAPQHGGRARRRLAQHARGDPAAPARRLRAHRRSRRRSALAALGEQFAVRALPLLDLAERVDSVGALDVRRRPHAGRRRARPRARGARRRRRSPAWCVVTDGADGAPRARRRARSRCARAARRCSRSASAARRLRATSRSTASTRRAPCCKAAPCGRRGARAHGLGGAVVPVVVEDDGRIIARREVTLPPAATRRGARHDCHAPEAGPHRLTVRVAAAAGERVAENNERDAAARRARDARARCSTSRESRASRSKFLRRAVAGRHATCSVVALQRTAEDKYLRLGVDDSLELVGGFPTPREELFAYRAIDSRQRESSSFTGDQLRCSRSS